MSDGMRPDRVDSIYTLGSNSPVERSVLKDSGTRQGFESGAVRDAQQKKGAFHLVPEVVIFLLARIYEEGAKKYAARNWEKGMPISVYINSAQRHLAKYKMGMRDEPHLSQALWNVAGALWTAVMVHLGLRDPKLNDMPSHVGSLAWKGYEDGRDGWEAPPLSPSEVDSLKAFGLDRKDFLEADKQKEQG